MAAFSCLFFEEGADVAEKHSGARRQGAPAAMAGGAAPLAGAQANARDAFSNPMARLGSGTQNLLEATQYPLTRLTQNHALLSSLYRSSWIVQNIIGTVPEDVTKKWFKASTALEPAKLAKLDRLQRATRLRRAVVGGMRWGRLYGGAAGLILLKGCDRLDRPLSLDEVMPGSFRGLYVVDRWSGVSPCPELIRDIADADFGYPEFYEIRDPGGAVALRAHHSRVVRFEGRELPWHERVAESHWGQSEIEAIYEDIVKRDNVSHNLASLTFRANVNVQEMENVDQLLALGGAADQRRFWSVLQAQSALESNLGTRLINKGDRVHQLQYSFAGLPEVYDAMMMDVAGAARIPVTKLFGRSPAGMNATGESDLQNYYDYIDEKREFEFRPIVEKLLPIMALSAWGELPDDLDFAFEALRTPTELEKADIAQKKAVAIIEAFNANGLTQGALMRELKALSEQGGGIFSSITDGMIAEGEGVWAKDLQRMDDPLMGLMGEAPGNAAAGGGGGADGAEGNEGEDGSPGADEPGQGAGAAPKGAA
jgi:phage-related protein (TIGR01555 family)